MEEVYRSEYEEEEPDYVWVMIPHYKDEGPYSRGTKRRD